MLNDNKNKIIIVSLVLLIILCLSIGFAAFQNLLTISTTANITPGEGAFKVVFSTNSTKLETNPVTPVTYGTATANSAIINNEGSQPTIENLSSSLLNPGDKVEYNFYIYNAGRLNAMLNNVIFNNADGKSTFKVCIPGEGASKEVVDYACKAIQVTVNVNNERIAYYKTGKRNGISFDNFVIAPNQSVPIQVVLEYTNYSFESQPVIADGPFSIIYGDISLEFMSTAVSTISTY